MCDRYRYRYRFSYRRAPFRSSHSIAKPIAIAIAGRHLAAFGRAAFEVAATDKRSRLEDAATEDARREL